MDYQEFLEKKAILDIPTGFDCGELNKHLFDWQADEHIETVILIICTIGAGWCFQQIAEWIFK